MIKWTDEQLKQAGIDKKKLTRLVKKLIQCDALMRELGLEVYGAGGTGHLIHESRPEHDKAGKPDFEAVVADVGYGFNGGDW